MSDQTTTEARLWTALHDVEDPELTVNIIDLGLIVDLQFHCGTVSLKLTFTAMGCPAMDMIMDDVRACLTREPEVRKVDIEVVWAPIWTKARLTNDGRAQLRESGISV
jgi:metal-sulfur cluster biosynthetic enzyme